MPDTFEALSVVALVLVPGFIGFYVARETSPAPSREISDIELALVSISFAVFVLAAEVGLVALLAGWLDDLALLGGLTVDEWDEGYTAVLRRAPGRVIPIATGEYLLHTSFVALLGWFDPAGRVLERRRQKRGFTADDPLTAGLVLRRNAPGIEKSHTFLRIVMTDSSCYYGYLSAMSNAPDRQGNRDIVLQGVTFAGTPDTAPSDVFPRSPQSFDLSVVTVNTRNIRAIEALFTTPVA
jgi:Family of unknown function (DUF6338)